MITTAATSSTPWRGVGAWSPRPGGAFQARKRYTLKLISQANVNTCGGKTVKRKRPVFDYSSSDTEEGKSSKQEETAHARRHTKRPCHVVEEIEGSKSAVGYNKSPLGSSVSDEDDSDDTPGAKSKDKSALDPDNSGEDELTIEYARSAEHTEVDLSDIYDGIDRTSPDDDLYEESSSPSGESWDSGVAFCERPDVQQFIKQLPNLLTRPYRENEPLRVKFLNRQFEDRLSVGDFTDEQIQEVILQRPLYGTYADFNIPTPRLMPGLDDDVDTSDLTELELEDMIPPERPSTPRPRSGSDSGSDSDSEEESIYSQHLSRREMEAFGIYEDEYKIVRLRN